MIPGSTSALLLASAAGGAGQYQISRSLRFNSADSAYLSRTPASAGNRKTWTWSGWVKRSAISNGVLFSASTNNTSASDHSIGFSNDNLFLQFYEASAIVGRIDSTAVFRDPSAWYHIIAVADTTQATAASRLRLYVNGSEITSFSSATYPSQNYDSAFSAANAHSLGRSQGNAGSYFNGYLADIHFIDGQALTPASFGETDATTGQWIPKAYTGTYGTNGFKLDFADNSAATAAALGKDTSGNGNNWTPNNLSVTAGTGSYIGSTSGTLFSGGWRSAFDGTVAVNSSKPYVNTTTATLTFPSALSGTIEVFGSNGSGSSTGGVSYIALSDGSQWSVSGITSGNAQWYSFGSKTGITSISIVAQSGSQGTWLGAVRVNGTVLVDYGTATGNDSLVDTPTSYGTDTGVGGEVRGNYCTLNPLEKANLQGSGLGPLTNGNLELVGATATQYTAVSNVAITTSAYAEFTGSSDYCGLRRVGNSDYCIWAGTNYSVAASGGDPSASVGASYTTTDVIGVAFNPTTLSLSFYKNGTLAFTKTAPPGDYLFFVSQTGTGNHVCNFGQRPFAYTAPSGFKALCDTNLPAPTIVKPSTVMDVKLYTGNGSTQTVSGLGFSPDLVWIKSRSANNVNHMLFDQIRGAEYYLNSNTTGAEGRAAGYCLTAFTSSGFTVVDDAAGSYAVNGSGAYGPSYVAWAWDAGSSTVTNTAGTIQSSVRANASAGFSVVTYTGTGANATVGHGLGVAPQFYVVKNRSISGEWYGYHVSSGAGNYLLLNTTAAATASTTVWNNTAPSSTVFSLGASSSNTASSNFVAYCFAPVAGYSAFGSYTGNGSADGPFVYTGFRPRWVLIKQTSAGTENWILLDSARDTYNQLGEYLNPNTSAAAASTGLADFLSNGFKLRANTGAATNANAGTYVYAAFAEFPFQYARSR